MNIFRFAAVIACEPLSFRQGLSARTTILNEFATQNGKPAETNVVVPKAYQLLFRKKSGFAADDSSHKTDKGISESLPEKWDGFSESEKGTVKTVSADKDVYNATLEKLPRRPPGTSVRLVCEGELFQSPSWDDTRNKCTGSHASVI